MACLGVRNNWFTFQNESIEINTLVTDSVGDIRALSLVVVLFC